MSNNIASFSELQTSNNNNQILAETSHTQSLGTGRFASTSVQNPH